MSLNRFKKQGGLVLALALLSFVATACYTFSGASIPPTVKTFSVQFFENRSQLVDPALSQKMTEGLKDRVSGQSSLVLMRGVGDVNFEGTITTYRVEPVAFTSGGGGANDRGQAEQNRLTIAVQVKSTNTQDEKLSFDQSFSKYVDFPKGTNFTSQQQQLNDGLIKDITTDIFNRAFSNW